MSTMRIMKVHPLPKQVSDWLYDHQITMTENTGESSMCFIMYDLEFTLDAEAIEFKLRFGEIVFTPEEIEISDEYIDDTDEGIAVNAKKCHLYDRKHRIYDGMRE